jgi:hypothetical protein
MHPRPALAALGLLVSSAALAQTGLEITSITLYRSGVGSFERRGVIDGDADVQLRFATDQVNDILKSMVLLDLDGGTVEAVSYGSREPLQRRLASFGVDLSDEPPLGTILARLRGARVRFDQTDSSRIEGTIVGGETRPEALGNADNPILVPYVNVLTSTGIRSANLTQSASVLLLDDDLAAELGKALAALAEHRADRVKTVDLRFRGEDRRRVVAAYVHEMPVWKTSYRLILPDDSAGDASPSIQGWAIVENTTDEDWENVRLSLVAGRPVSFTMDLYEPLFVKRPDVPVPLVPGAAPREYGAGQSPLRAGEVADGRLRSAGPDAAGRAWRDAADKQAAGSELERAVEGVTIGGVGDFMFGAEILRAAPAAAARGVESGEVFQFQLLAPVSVERQRSAMLPIINAPIEGRRVSIYSPMDGLRHPLRGVQLTNSTGLQLMPGPISVYDAGTYAGDAQVGHVPAGDRRLLAYAVDLDVTCQVEGTTDAQVQSIRIVNGLLERRTKRIANSDYAFESRDAKRPRRVVVEHPRQPGWDLVAPDRPAEQTQDLYRFEIGLDAGGKGGLRVVTENVERVTLAVGSISPESLLVYTRQGRASKAVYDAVLRAADLRAEAERLDAELRRLIDERAAIAADQDRIRQNLRGIDQRNELYGRYVQKLGEQETRLEEIQREHKRLSDALAAKRAELDAYVRGLNVE